MSAGRETYVLFRDQVARLEEQTSRKDAINFKVLVKLLVDLNTVTLAYGMANISRSLFVSLRAAMLGILKSESSLGIFTDDFERLTNLVSSALAFVSFAKDPAKKIVLQWYVELTIIAVIGLLHLALISKKELKEESENIASIDRLKLKQELVISLFFNTDYPKDVFKHMAASLGLIEKGALLIADALESIAIFSVLVAVSKAEATLESNLLDLLIPRLAKCLDNIDMQLAEANFAEEKDESGNFRAYLQQAKIAIEKKEIEPLIEGFKDILKTFDLSEENLRSDLEAIKKMFEGFLEAIHTSANHQTNTINLIG